MFGAFSISGAARAPTAPSAQWYYHTQNDPMGMPDGWYRYDSAINTTVEQTFQQAIVTGNGLQQKYLLPFASSGYQYEIDFQRMVQRNSRSGKERPICRTTNGQFPPAVPFTPAAPTLTLGAASTIAAPVSTMLGSSSRSRRNRNDTRVSTHYSCNLSYNAPENLHSVEVDESKVFQLMAPPQTKRRSKRHMSEEEKRSTELQEDDCAICLDALWDGTNTKQIVAIKTCSHLFHYDCIKEALIKGCGGRCPLCSKAIDEHDCGTAKTSRGKCPSATMKVTNMHGISCGGYEDVDLLQISYNIPSGTQKKYHPAPYLPFSGDSRTAYIPNNMEGRDLLSRIQYAFMHGLCFMVGTSLTTGNQNTVTWASIHHKTSCYGGTYGYPDPTYFQRANSELNALGVPDPAGCRAWLFSKCPGYI
ncbi:WWE domain containing protein [Nitzschia inconspicua]|uniref:WWE domain containing protein n=1 Tax=Nitzschia inconspicua TaxID=303405 RepID=A0A9K3LRG4_9STRA|nr:WWE domain containing protein [Nitzschia inconspicua]